MSNKQPFEVGEPAASQKGLVGLFLMIWRADPGLGWTSCPFDPGPESSYIVCTMYIDPSRKPPARRVKRYRKKKKTITYEETKNNSACGLGPGDPSPHPPGPYSPVNG